MQRAPASSPNAQNGASGSLNAATDCSAAAPVAVPVAPWPSRTVVQLLLHGERQQPAELVQIVRLDRLAPPGGLLDRLAPPGGLLDRGGRPGRVTQERRGTRLQRREPDADRAVNLLILGGTPAGVEQGVLAPPGPVRDEAPQPVDKRTEGGVLGLLGTDAGGAGVHHRRALVAEVVAGLGHVPGQQRGHHVELPHLRRPGPTALDEAEGIALRRSQVVEQRRERHPRVLLGDAADLVLEVSEGLVAQLSLLSAQGEVPCSSCGHGSPSSHLVEIGALQIESTAS
ncbi:hypothetical protein [Streptomyces cyaneofuscatus]|uniref:hypothetical protein n=1 Tax=Streptomyces cyaneofuscatus TaxID=66883 RepID=UPI00368D9A60